MHNIFFRGGHPALSPRPLFPEPSGRIHVSMESEAAEEEDQDVASAGVEGDGAGGPRGRWSGVRWLVLVGMRLVFKQCFEPERECSNCAIGGCHEHGEGVPCLILAGMKVVFKQCFEPGGVFQLDYQWLP